MIKPEIIPAVLAPTFDEFAEQIGRLEKLFSAIQIDVMDGMFVPNKSFQKIEKINELQSTLKFELHLMVNDPLAEMEKWKKVNNIFRVIFHAEAPTDLNLCFHKAKEMGWQAGLALNPPTPLSAAEQYFNLTDLILFMTVNPGQQGAPFTPEVEEKIRRFTSIKKRPLCAVDGGINKNNIALVRSWGAEIFGIGSALTMSDNIELAYKELLKQLEK